MGKKKDIKLHQTVRVVLHRINEKDLKYFTKNVESNKLQNKHEVSEKSPKIEEKPEKKLSIPSVKKTIPSIKKEKKHFEMVDWEIQKFSKQVDLKFNPSFVKIENFLLDSCKIPSMDADTKQLVFSHPRNWFVAKTKTEKETEESLKSIKDETFCIPGFLSERSHLQQRRKNRFKKTKNTKQPIDEIENASHEEHPLVRTEKPDVRSQEEIQNKIAESQPHEINIPLLIHFEAFVTIPIPSETVARLRESVQQGSQTTKDSSTDVYTEKVSTKTSNIRDDLHSVKEPNHIVKECNSMLQRFETGTDGETHLTANSVEPYTTRKNSIEKSVNTYETGVTRQQTPEKPKDEDIIENAVKKTKHAVKEHAYETDLSRQQSPDEGIIEKAPAIIEKVPATMIDIKTNHYEATVKSVNNCMEKLNGNDFTSDDPTTRILDHPDIISQNLDTNMVKVSITSPLNMGSCISQTTSHPSIKVKNIKTLLPLGTESQNALEESKVTFQENFMDIIYLSKKKWPKGNEPKMAEIGELYPIFCKNVVRHNISELINIIHKASRGDDTSNVETETCSKSFVKRFKKILKLDQIGSDKNLLRKIIPILYLQMYKAFERLRPGEDFDFRMVMKKIFNVEHFVCKHDIILDVNYDQFKKGMDILEKWIADKFIECDLSDCMGAANHVTVDIEDDDMNDSDTSRFNLDSQEEPMEVIENYNASTSEQTKNISEDILEFDPNEEYNYLLCQVCKKSVSMCCICKELLASCPCLPELKTTLAFDRGPASLNLCKEHYWCGDTWPQWESKFNEDMEEDYDIFLDGICWNDSCNKKSKMICVCKIRAYCSLDCQVEDWRREHHKTCRKESDPECCVTLEEDMDVS